jgi:antitoxin (DNA-binding transcriptional repressor) of toxin-antitoxin stability system
MRVGTKELKNRLSHYLRAVRAGEPVEITDRGVVVAEIRRASNPRSHDAALVALERRGLATLPRGKVRDLGPVRRKKERLVSAMVIEDRR